jgi:hypothetical protein
LTSSLANLIFPEEIETVSQMAVAILILIMSFVVLLLGYNMPKSRVILVSIGFFTLMSGVYASYSNWLPQVRGEVPVEAPAIEGDIASMSPEKLAEMGETIIFGRVVGGNPNDGDVGKAQCPLCHRVSGTVIRDRGPDLTAAWDAPDGSGTKGVVIGKRGESRVKDSRYMKPDTVQTESHPGSGRATTSVEYLAESHACPNCFVVAGFGTKGTNDRESPMPIIHKPPISLSLDELVAVDTYLFVKDGLPPPPVGEIRAAYEKFIPEKDRPAAGPVATAAAVPAGGLDPTKIALPADTPEQIITKMQCFVCHQIPTIAMAKIGVIGPILIEGENAKKRMASPEYKARIKAGKATATTPKAYVMESIMHPNAFVVPAFVIGDPEKSAMIQDFAQKFTFDALEKLTAFLLSLDCKAAMKDGLKGPPQEPVDKICGPATKAARASSPDETTKLQATPQQHAAAVMAEEVK